MHRARMCMWNGIDEYIAVIMTAAVIVVAALDVAAVMQLAGWVKDTQ